MTFSLNNYPADDPRLAQAKLWEEAFVQELQAFQQRMAGTFQVAFMAEVGGGGSWLCGGRLSGCRGVLVPLSWVALGNKCLPRWSACEMGIPGASPGSTAGHPALRPLHGH